MLRERKTMGVMKRAYVVVLILSLLLVNENLRPASANFVSTSPLWQKIFKILNSRNGFTGSLWRWAGRLRLGDVHEGISELKDRFKLSGYLNFTSNSDSTNVFSADLESAIKDFQETYHLNVTGQPDSDTESLIKLPRCAVSDATNGPFTVQENRTTVMSRLQGKKELTYAFSPENETAAWKEAFADAFGRWSDVTGLNFSETAADSFDEADIQIMFLGWKGGFVGGTWVGNTMTSRKIVLNFNEKWALPSENATESDKLDRESAAMHQIGHVLGLNHSATEEAIMYPFIVPSRKRKVNFTNDDLQKIQQVYSAKADSSDQTSVGLRWDMVSALWLGIALLLGF